MRAFYFSRRYRDEIRDKSSSRLFLAYLSPSPAIEPSIRLLCRKWHVKTAVDDKVARHEPAYDLSDGCIEHDYNTCNHLRIYRENKSRFVLVDTRDRPELKCLTLYLFVVDSVAV